MNTEVVQILRAIPELAHIVLSRGEVTYTPPVKNIMEHRAQVVVPYLQQYASLRGFTGEFFLCLYDGWREYSAPSNNPIFVPWREVDPNRFGGLGSELEPRFMHVHSDDIFPVLPLHVLAFCRHVGDINTFLIPDAQFLRHQFKHYCDQVEAYDIEWDVKQGDTLFWRGQRHVTNYPGQTRPHPRDFITSQALPFIDAHFSNATPISHQLRHKYLIDVDGMVSAWSGLFWKLKSNSVPIKLESHWEQWYYYLLRDRYNIILSADNLAKAFEELVGNDDLARSVSSAGAQLSRRLTFDFAVEEYVIS